MAVAVCVLRCNRWKIYCFRNDFLFQDYIFLIRNILYTYIIYARYSSAASAPASASAPAHETAEWRNATKEKEIWNKNCRWRWNIKKANISVGSGKWRKFSSPILLFHFQVEQEHLRLRVVGCACVCWFAEWMDEMNTIRNKYI